MFQRGIQKTKHRMLTKDGKSMGMKNLAQTISYRDVLAASALVTFIHIIISQQQTMASEYIPFALFTGIFIVACGLLAWWHQDGDTWLYYPPMAAMGLLVLQLLTRVLPLEAAPAALAALVHPGLTALILACLIIPLVALIVPDERGTSRHGGRAMQQAKRYRRLAYGAALAAWLLLPLTTMGASATSSTLYYSALVLAGALTVLVSWQTWRTRKHDQLLLSTAGVASGLLLLLAGVETIAIITLQPVPQGLQIFVLTGLWGSLVTLAALVLRRPVPAVVEPAAAETGAHAQAKQPSLLADYISLTKPKVISLLLLTTLAAMFITGEGMPSAGLVFWTMLGGYLAAGGAGAINCALDKNIDLYMGRTSRRPVPSGRIPQQHAFWFGMVLSVLSVVILAVFTTWLAAALALVGIVYYALLYTRWLKPNTWQNIVIGGGAGAIPPLVGWAAVTGTLSLPAIILFMIIFYWTPPHFWALALVKQKDYARAGVPMLPVVAGEEETRWQILLYSLLLVFFTLILTPLQAMGAIYLLLATLLGAIFMRYAWNVWRRGEHVNIWGLYKYSLLYLALLFSAMVLDRALLS
jgi:protoheme IX farnesyltransferase